MIILDKILFVVRAMNFNNAIIKEKSNKTDYIQRVFFKVYICMRPSIIIMNVL